MSYCTNNNKKLAQERKVKRINCAKGIMLALDFDIDSATFGYLKGCEQQQSEMPA